MSEQRTSDLRLLAVLVALVLSGCAKQELDVQQTDNHEFQLDKLFTHEGCTVYRFSDAGYFHYWADCRGQVGSRYNCGKGCIRKDEVPTNE